MLTPLLDTEKQFLLESLNNGRDALETALAGIDDALASRKPPSGGWSILECVDHMVESERYLLTRLRIAQLSTDPPHPSREAKIAARAADRSRPIEAPSISRPSGQYPGLGEALAAFDAVRTEILQYVNGLTEDPRCWTTDHPLLPGPVTCQETLIMIAAHPARHAQQILEIRQAITSADRRRRIQPDHSSASH
jgi:uncharacterized damage-inducible protein DinB